VVDLARDSLNPQLELLGVCLNIANMRTQPRAQTLEALRGALRRQAVRTVIRQSIAYAESAERAIPILEYRPDRGADYLSLASEISASARQAGSAGAAGRAERRGGPGWCILAGMSPTTTAKVARGDHRVRTTMRGTPMTSTRSHRCTRRTWSSRTTRPASARGRGGPRAHRRDLRDVARHHVLDPPPLRTDGLVVQEWTAAATHASEMRRGDLVAEPTGKEGQLGRPRRDPVRGRAREAKGRLLGLGVDPAAARPAVGRGYSRRPDAPRASSRLAWISARAIRPSRTR
jgi:hypothetical protein